MSSSENKLAILHGVGMADVSVSPVREGQGTMVTLSYEQVRDGGMRQIQDNLRTSNVLLYGPLYEVVDGRILTTVLHDLLPTADIVHACKRSCEVCTESPGALSLPASDSEPKRVSCLSCARQALSKPSPTRGHEGWVSLEKDKLRVKVDPYCVSGVVVDGDTANALVQFLDHIYSKMVGPGRHHYRLHVSRAISEEVLSEVSARSTKYTIEWI